MTNKAVFIFFLFTIALNAQINNLQIFYNLLDSTAIEIANNSGTGYCLSVNKDNSLSVFNDRFTIHFPKFENAKDTIYIQFSRIKFSYSKFFRPSIFSSIKTVRKAEFEVLWARNGEVKSFYKAVNDTINSGDISSLEKDPFNFTKGDLTLEEFTESFFEPIIAITASAAAVILFFLVRSN